MFVVFFFVKHKTAYEMRISDWSSDVCSSDLAGAAAPIANRRRPDLSPVRDLYDGDARLFPAVLSRRPRHRPAVSPGPASGGVVTFDWSVITDNADRFAEGAAMTVRSEEHTSELQSLMRISYAVFCLNKNNKPNLYP